MAPGSGTSSGKQQHDYSEEEFNSNSGQNTVVKKHSPASTQECPSGYGSANIFKTKFQSEECISCNQILSEANGKEYDIYVAHQLCPNMDMQSSFVFIIIAFIILIVIVAIRAPVIAKRDVKKDTNMYKE